MMRLFSELYWGEKALARKDEILSALERKNFSPGIYLITRAVGPDGLLDIYGTGVFSGKGFREADPLVLGIASGKQEAFELTRTIVNDLYSRKGDFDLDAFCHSGNT